MTISDRIRVKNVRVLSDNYYVLKKRRSNTAVPTANGRRKPAKPMTAATGATVLPYNLAQRTVVLVASSAIRPMSTATTIS